MATIKRDYYEVLGCVKTADGKVLKSAYRKLAMEFHPDRNPDNPEAEDKFKELNEAYSILSDEQKRAAYDRMGHSAFGQGGGGSGQGGFQDFGDIFSQIFGGQAAAVVAALPICLVAKVNGVHCAVLIYATKWKSLLRKHMLVKT